MPLQIAADESQVSDVSAPETTPAAAGLLPAHTLNFLKRLGQGIVAMFGSACEVVIHDLADLECSVVWIEGNVTQRGIGSSMTDLGLQMIHSGQDRDHYNYETLAPDGRRLKSSSLFITNEAGEAIGLLCINMDISALSTAEKVLRSFTSTIKQETVEETFAADASILIKNRIDRWTTEHGRLLELMDKNDKVDLVAALEREGIFRLKRAPSMVAQHLGVSRQSIYKYLQKRPSEDEDF